MTKKSNPKFTVKFKLGEIQKLYAREKGEKPRKEPLRLLTLYLPSRQVDIKVVMQGERTKTRIFVRDEYMRKMTTHFGRWRQFHSAEAFNFDRLKSLDYVGLTAPVEAWIGINLDYINRSVLRDHPWAVGARGQKNDKGRKAAAKKEAA